MDKYFEFLETKKIKHLNSGFDVLINKLNKHLFDFQKHIVKKSLKSGKYAIFADCGLGKTIMQLEWAFQVAKKTKKPVLILCPLAVSGQTINEGEKFKIEVIKYDGSNFPIQIINYEQLDNINVELFSGVILDESSILKNFTGHYKNLIINTFKKTPYKLACTATPSPNDLNEIGNHSEFLDVLDAQDMRSKWFVRDQGMNNYRLKNHAKTDFYGWISSWATMITNPADIGFDGTNFILPKLQQIEHEIITDVKVGSGLIFNESAVNATNFNKVLRETKEKRLQKVVEICEKIKGQILIWVKQNEEGDWLQKKLENCKEVKGSDSTEYKEKTLLGFANNEFKILITKAKIAQFGMNFQNCSTQIFPSLDFSFEAYYQQIRRSYRFGQKNEVNIHLIKTDTMENVVKSIEKKERQFLEMQQEMNKNINNVKYGLLDTYERREFKNNDVLLIKGDSCIEIKTIPDNSVDLIIFSPPFSSLFTYSNYVHDMGNNENHEEFFKQYAFLLKDLFRILKPGRLMCCHTKDLGVYKNFSGYTGMFDFTGEHTKAVLNEEFKLHSKITIWCDPVLEMQRTKTQRLLYKQVTSDSSKTGIGMAEYITIFKKWDGSSEELWEPITNLSKSNFPLDIWQKWASPVWMDIKRTDVLNGKEGTALGDEKHIAPLQLEVIHRLIHLWSNEGEIIFTPFLGIGSEIYKAVKNNRKGIGIELKDSYFDTAVKNVKKAFESKLQSTIIFE
ncbi:MAG: methylase N-4/N-6 domain protein [Candidatus Moranbacteria bacterium GW2011_GWF1_36_4]|nr:MAG: methylase N-4/N-6 domain protein [Candidatus Moranbacteria bacterium GW2011_GWF1_36_4]